MNKQIKILLISFFTILKLYNNQPQLLIKIPTRSRPEQFFKMLDKYYDFLSKEIPYTFLITCDNDDITMNCQEVKNKLRKYPNLFFYFDDCLSKIDAYNKHIDLHLDFDILLVTSDDMEPIAKGYDKIIADKMLESFPDFDGVLNFHDGNLGKELNTMPVIGKKFYERFGYIYHPSYKGFYCDNELTKVSEKLGKEKACYEIIIRHNHWAFNSAYKSDELYARNQHSWNIDQGTYNKRHSDNFPIDKLELESKIKWSILICTLKERSHLFNKVYNKLKQQIEKNGLSEYIEILYFSDNRENTIGYKRNELLKQSKGKYVCFIDDDDDVHDEYIKLIYDKLQEDCDCVNLEGIITFNGTNPTRFSHSIKYKDWFYKDGIYYRPPLHFNTIKRRIALQYEFPEINFGEDKAWCMDICNANLIKTESTIETPIYFYLYDATK